MKYLLKFNENDNLGRRGTALSIYDNIIDMTKDFTDETDFKIYITPFEIVDTEENEIIKRTTKSISKGLKNSNQWISIVFDLKLNNISKEFDDVKREQIIQKIKDLIIHFKPYLDNLGYQTSIDKMQYCDVPPKKKVHQKGYWHQQSWTTTPIDKIKWAEKIRLSIKEKF